MFINNMSLSADLLNSVRRARINKSVPIISNKIKRELNGKISNQSSLDIYNYYVQQNATYTDCVTRFGLSKSVIAYHIQKHRNAQGAAR